MPGFWDCDGEQHPEEAGDDHEDPEDPAESQVESDIAGHDERHRGPKRAAESVDGHGEPAGIALPQITHGASGVGQRCAACQPCQQSTDDHGADIGHQGEWQLEQAHEEPRNQIYRLAAVVFGQGSQQHRPNGVSQHVHGQAQRGHFGRDVEMLCNLGGARRKATGAPGSVQSVYTVNAWISRRT